MNCSTDSHASGNEMHDPARGFEHQERQPEMSEQAERAPAAAAVDLQLGFDLRFEYFQVFVDCPVVMRPSSR